MPDTYDYGGPMLRTLDTAAMSGVATSIAGRTLGMLTVRYGGPPVEGIVVFMDGWSWSSRSKEWDRLRAEGLRRMVEASARTAVDEMMDTEEEGDG